MDFSNWKKLKDDGKSCTLIHPKGHTMTIAVKALPKIQQEAIKRLKMADGGKIEKEEGMSEQGKDVRYGHKSYNREDKEMSKDFAKEEAKGRAEFERTVKPKMKGLAEGGKINYQSYKNKELAKRGHEELKKKIPSEEQRAKNKEFWNQADAVLKTTPKNGQYQYADGGVAHYDEGTSDAPVSESDVPAQEDQDGTQAPVHNGSPIVINVGQAQPQGQNQVPQPELPQTPPPPATASIPAEAQKTLGSIDQQKAAIQGQAEIEAAKAKAAEPAIAENIQSQRELQQSAQNALDNVNQHVDDFNSYMDKNGIINPKHYQENMTSGQKVSTAIGLFLGGMGVPFGGHNYAFDFLNKQIDRDIAAQGQNIENKKTVLGAYQQLYGENTAAIAAARATMDHIYAKRIEQSAIQLGTPQAKVNAQIGITKLMQDSVEKRQEAAALLSNGVNQPNKQPDHPNGANNVPQAPNEHILRPDSNDIFKKIQYDPTLKPYAAQIAEQKAKADLADKALDVINDKFPAMAKNTQGAMGYIHRNGPPILGTLPFLGEAINSGSRFATNTPANRNYDSDYSAVIGAVRGALQGNVAEDLLDRTVKANTPESEDTPQLIKRKMDTLKEFIRSHTKTDMLDMAKLTGR